MSSHNYGVKRENERLAIEELSRCWPQLLSHKMTASIKPSGQSHKRHPLAVGESLQLPSDETVAVSE